MARRKLPNCSRMLDLLIEDAYEAGLSRGGEPWGRKVNSGADANPELLREFRVSCVPVRDNVALNGRKRR